MGDVFFCPAIYNCKCEGASNIPSNAEMYPSSGGVVFFIMGNINVMIINELSRLYKMSLNLQTSDIN